MSAQELVSVVRGAWVRHGSSARQLGFWSVANYHVGRYAQKSSSPLLRRGASSLYGATYLLLDLLTGVQLNRESQVGDELRLLHGWNIKIHPATVIGHRVTIMHDVTLGTTPDRDGAPIIGDDVFIGCGARLLGPVRIGARARIAANSLIVSDVPADSTAIGVPARVMRYTGRETPTEPPAKTPGD